jgi:hypothetical protein
MIYIYIDIIKYPQIQPVRCARLSQVTFKKRPFGIARYAPGSTGTGAVVMEVTPKSRYPGDPQGQAFVAGVQPGWVVKAVNGQDVTGVPFESIMESLDDEVLDPVAALSLNLKESGTVTNFDSSTQADKSYGAVGESTFQFGGGQKARGVFTRSFANREEFVNRLSIDGIFSGFYSCETVLKLTIE